MHGSSCGADDATGVTTRLQDLDGGHGAAVPADKELVEQLGVQLAQRAKHNRPHRRWRRPLPAHHLHQVAEPTQQTLQGSTQFSLPGQCSSQDRKRAEHAKPALTHMSQFA